MGSSKLFQEDTPCQKASFLANLQLPSFALNLFPKTCTYFGEQDTFPEVWSWSRVKPFTQDSAVWVEDPDEDLLDEVTLQVGLEG